MKNLFILLLAVCVLSGCLSACANGGEAMDTEPSVAVSETEISEGQSETGEGKTEFSIPEEVTEPEYVTMPEMEMPTQPDADYILPPEDTFPGEVITE